MGCPLSSGLARLRHCVRYLLGVRGRIQRLIADSSAPARVEVYVDSDWAGCPCIPRSTDCIMASLSGHPVVFSSKTQTVIAQSSAEAELGAIHRGCCHGLHISNIWAELEGAAPPITIFINSSAGRAIAVRRGCGRIRHLSVRQMFVQQLVHN